jgi:uncharacterized membrane protein YebE (DUF533 family)
MLLFDLKDFNKEDMITYLKAMAAIAAIDGTIHDAEMAYFNHMMDLFNVPEYSKMSIRQNLKNPPALGPLLKVVEDDKLQKQIIRDAYLMAYIDEEMKPEESDALGTVCRIFKVDDEQIKKIEQWAKNGYNWRKEGQDLL